MSAIGKNQGQISQDIAAEFTDDAFQPDADISNGTVNRDIADVSATQIAAAYAEMEVARKAVSLRNAETTDANALSQIALNFDVIRGDATKATGTTTFQASSRPSSNIGIPAGTLIWTQPLHDGTYIVYTTDSDATLTTSASRNPLNGLYEVDVDVTASVAGKGSHVGVNALVVLPNRIAGISSITNKAAINNAGDGDTNDELSTAVLEKTAGSSLGTPSGYVSLILDNFPTVSGAALVGPLDSDNQRVQYGNEVDVPIISTDATSFTAILTTNGSINTRFEDTRPVISVSSVVGTTNGVNYVSNTDYGFSRDTGAVYGYSPQSFDGLTWFPGRVPGPGLHLSVQGTYDANAASVQDFLDAPQRHYITGGLLVKTAQEVPVDVAVSVAASSGVDSTQLASDVQTAITDALAEYTLGQDVLEDDLVTVINAVAGAFSVDIPFTTLRKSTDSVSADSIDIRAQEYARAGTITVTVN